MTADQSKLFPGTVFISTVLDAADTKASMTQSITRVYLMRAAMAAGAANTADGLGMLVEQAAEAFALWRGVQPPSAQVLDELRDLLLAQQA